MEFVFMLRPLEPSSWCWQHTPGEFVP